MSAGAAEAVGARRVRVWSLVHKWTSLVSTLFLLLLCLTGLPLVFHHEIDELIGEAAAPADLPPGTPALSLDHVARAALAAAPGSVIQYLVWEKDEPHLVVAITNDRADGDPNRSTSTAYDTRTAAKLGPSGTAFTVLMLRLHVDLFAGLPGKLFLGVVGLLFIAAIVSGVVLYKPFMRRLPFGTVRLAASRRIAWLDLHNLLGIVTVVWALVVGATGVVNTWADLMLDAWRASELAAMVAPYAGKPAPAQLASLDGVVANAREAAPGMAPSFIAFPGTPFSSPHHYAVFMRGETVLASRLLKPVLVDGETGKVTDARALPWYLTLLLVSQPLHFGDYGGLPLKIIWAALDVATIVVLATGLYLWWAKHRRRAGNPVAPAPARSRRIDSASSAPARVFRVPIAIGLLAALGLGAALSGDGTARVFAWIALGLPLPLVALLLLRGRRARE